MTTSYEAENGHPEHHIINGTETDSADSDASEVNMIISIEPHLVVPIYNTRRPVLGMGLQWALSSQDKYLHTYLGRPSCRPASPAHMSRERRDVHQNRPILSE